LREEIEETMALLVDDRMSSFLKKNYLAKNSSILIDETVKETFREISRNYKIDLKALFPNLSNFTTGHRAFFNEKGIFIIYWLKDQSLILINFN
jgi:hypothetical protein